MARLIAPAGAPQGEGLGLGVRRDRGRSPGGPYSSTPEVWCGVGFYRGGKKMGNESDLYPLLHPQSAARNHQRHHLQVALLGQ